MEANPEDATVLVPAFSGLGAPWWKNDARAMLYGMSRTTGKKEIVKAACESIAYQINAVVQAMREDTGLAIETLSVDGGATGNEFLMQFQSDIANARIRIPDMQELSVLGPVYAAGLVTGFYDETVFQALSYKEYQPEMSAEARQKKLDNWNEAIDKLLK
jgi:glycerol kinase